MLGIVEYGGMGSEMVQGAMVKVRDDEKWYVVEHITECRGRGFGFQAV